MSIVPSDLRVVDLRKELTSRGLPTKGKKKDLIKRLEKALANEPPATDNLTNETPLNDHTSEEKSSEETSKEQIVEPIHEEKLADKPAEETIQQHIEPPTSSDVPPQNHIEITNEQKVEPSSGIPMEAISKEEDEPIIEIPQDTSEKPVDTILNSNTVQVEVVEKPAEDSIQPNEELIKKPQEQLIERPTEELIIKAQEPLIMRPSEEIIAKPQEPLIVESSEEIMTKPQEELAVTSDEKMFEIPPPVENPLDQLIQNPINPFIDNSQLEEDDLVHHRDTVSSIARDQMVTPPKEDLEFKLGVDMLSNNDAFKTQDSMMFNEDRGIKRKTDDELYQEEADKRQKTTINNNDNVRLLF